MRNTSGCLLCGRASPNRTGQPCGTFQRVLSRTVALVESNNMFFHVSVRAGLRVLRAI
jgi:hypothetical protein